MEFRSQTASLCPHCLRRIPARRITENGAVYMEKSCPEHGDLERVLLWRNFPKSYQEWTRCVPADASSSDDCPSDCGLCDNHKQKTCTAIIEVTQRCSLGCPVCFSASGTSAKPDPDLKQLAQILEMLRDGAGTCPVQISGGEPTLRDDLPQIVALARSFGFDHIQINTNGLRLARDVDYARALMESGATAVYLQFDGVTGSVYRQIRGTDLLQAKIDAVERCSMLKIGVILVPTLVKNANDSQVGAIIQFAKDWMPTVKGVHFQPMTYLGRYPNSPCNDDRLLLSDVLAAIEEQTGGELKIENLIPSG